MARIGFIGLGNMGLPMALNLVKAGHEVTGFDLFPQGMDKLKEGGGKTGKDVNSIVADSEVVITMLPAGKHVLEVWGGGLLSAAKPGTIFIDCSTIDVASARAAHDMAAKAGMLSLDAPVSGGVGGAEGATLTLMVGGTKDAFAKGQPTSRASARRSCIAAIPAPVKRPRSATT